MLTNKFELAKMEAWNNEIKQNLMKLSFNVCVPFCLVNAWIFLPCMNIAVICWWSSQIGTCNIDIIFCTRFFYYDTKISEIQKRPRCCRKILNRQEWKREITKFNKIRWNYHLIYDYHSVSLLHKYCTEVKPNHHHKCRQHH
jgi:hypothetical protein